MSNENKIKLIECPRDAMQGWHTIIPTEKKIEYLNNLLKVGFDTIDFGSFVSPKAIPQMADTAEVVKSIDLSSSQSKLLAIIANERGAAEACVFENIHYLGFPFSISETFQLRNTNAGISQSLQRVEAIQELCVKNKKELVVYISMAFGNPYSDPYDESIVFKWVSEMVKLGITTISLADTVGLASAEQVGSITKYLVGSLPAIDIGVHLHSTPLDWKAKTEAALDAGCTSFDGALKGIGGCPMAGNELVGNMDTELMIPYFNEKRLLPALNMEALQKCSAMAAEIFI